MIDLSCFQEAPHGAEVIPSGVAYDPRDARVEVYGQLGTPPPSSSTDNQPPPRQKGEAVQKPWFREVGDGAGVGGRERKQLNL